ncbi:hypothetical protein RvY_07919 [Ramazzottius varieornatus]|uniref:protein kinase C n=1 Tax=Ramazzottius varieornatus TaxID=947166 RepID=A0A1D1V8V6_RAMVA|nr:hypothetical protein RvY_07919 [Ramazzottius varieornatus]
MSSSNLNGEIDVLHFRFQCGLHREPVACSYADLSLRTLKERATLFVERSFPNHGIKKLQDRLLLYRHDSSTENILQMLQVASEVSNGTLLEIVISGDDLGGDDLDDLDIRPHHWVVHNYKTPTFCDHCSEMLLGITKQGLKCECCGMNSHKNCAYKIPNSCAYTIKTPRPESQPDLSNLATRKSNEENHNPHLLGIPGMRSGRTSNNRSPSPSSMMSSSSTVSVKSNANIRPPIIDRIMSKRVKVPHTFVLKTFKVPTLCRICQNLLKGLFRQGLRCKDCGMTVHEKCAGSCLNDCTGEPPSAEMVSPSTTAEHNPKPLFYIESQASSAVEPDIPVTVTGADGEAPTIPQPANTSNQIVAQRLFQSKRSKDTMETLPALKEGWLVHYTSKNPTRLRHYWRLNSSKLIMYQSDTDRSVFCKIPLERIFSMDAGGQLPSPHTFQIRTASLVFYVGDKPQSANAEGWAVKIKKCLMPVGRTEEMDSKNRLYCPLEDIHSYCQIFPDDVLGAGQFGVVYTCKNRLTGAELAVKVTDKPRLTVKEAARMKAEVEIMRCLNHPGVISVDGFFENSKHVFIIMEKLPSDMLKFILSTEKRRLSERMGKFFTYQILAALGYLHSKKIAHCDLKPENILLTSELDFPQIKLCDFGFSKIIGESSFRKSIVGTPAYLAPEALSRNKRYNRLLDMWSVGIIIYVTLAGVFPFHENEDLADQIRNPRFMFPKDPWAEISAAAVDLIKHLLVLEIKNRYTVYKAAQHNWFLDYQMYADLRNLESAVGKRYLTHEADDARWEEYRKSRNLPDFAPAQKDYFTANYDDSDKSDEESDVLYEERPATTTAKPPAGEGAAS